MIETIHLDPKLKKCLVTLKKGSRRACLAADRVETIIDALKTGGTLPEQVCAFTRNGEARIKGCRKFNLGAGYRLVTLKQDSDLYLLFAGTHDECSRWIENNRDHLPLEMIAERSRTVKRPIPQASPAKETHCTDKTEPEEDWIPPLDDRDLRVIFSGLVNGN
ncbi:hypothetical protein [Desulfosarcina ovata]|uniref:Uncharacterized protein n=2 Tax=Desulfosarcina ovata TaxID=83564 RepID=A0A5K8AAF6_9BACT|nr:hypothetical protein [Desulfosarcina ovata]BBO82384.1 hypothetical protein DSCO28_29500 [Desulfosarcina ovata subsp. sediminis]BBO89575.1 hypothetical protein DSCOOX_27550 [Desulfosarcina ovata subsp. ovata]